MLRYPPGEDEHVLGCHGSSAKGSHGVRVRHHRSNPTHVLAIRGQPSSRARCGRSRAAQRYIPEGLSGGGQARRPGPGPHRFGYLAGRDVGSRIPLFSQVFQREHVAPPERIPLLSAGPGTGRMVRRSRLVADKGVRCGPRGGLHQPERQGTRRHRGAGGGKRNGSKRNSSPS